MVENYDRIMVKPFVSDYYESTGYHNYGYWDETTQNQGEASENLVRKLLEPIALGQGRILDVACGLGASTRYLANFYSPSDITAVNLSRPQLGHARAGFPGVDFLQMDAAHLA